MAYFLISDITLGKSVRLGLPKKPKGVRHPNLIEMNVNQLPNSLASFEMSKL